MDVATPSSKRAVLANREVNVKAVKSKRNIVVQRKKIVRVMNDIVLSEAEAEGILDGSPAYLTQLDDLLTKLNPNRKSKRVQKDDEEEGEEGEGEEGEGKSAGSKGSSKAT